MKSDRFKGWKIATELGLDVKSKYLDFCEQAVKDDEVFNNFKKADPYVVITEDTGNNLGMSYYEKVKTDNPDLLDHIEKFQKIEKIGGPKTMDVDPFLSAPTLRYLKVLSDLKTCFGDLSGYNIIEIGAAYGGQASIISQVYNFSNYYDVDLEWPLKLAKKYCSFNNVKNFKIVHPESLGEFSSDKTFDLVISNYALSECDEETQDFYIKTVLSKSKRGYITINGSVDRRNRLYEILKDYENFKIFNHDLCGKKHPIFVWGGE